MSILIKVITRVERYAMDQPNASWTGDQWREYNRVGLEHKNNVLWCAGDTSVAVCLHCNELLIRFSLDEEATTLILDRVWLDLKMIAVPLFRRYQRTLQELTDSVADLVSRGGSFNYTSKPKVATPNLEQDYHTIVDSLRELIALHPDSVKPKVEPIREAGAA